VYGVTGIFMALRLILATRGERRSSWSKLPVIGRFMNLAVFLLLTRPSLSATQQLQWPPEVNPNFCWTRQNTGNLILTVSNTNFQGVPLSTVDCFSGEVVSLRSVLNEYPKGSRWDLFSSMAFLIGGVIESDTIVSGEESPVQFAPDIAPKGGILSRSIIDSREGMLTDAVSELDLVAEYTDTISKYTIDALTRRPNQPLYVRVRQESFAWSYGYSNDFILFRLTIENFGRKAVKDMYVGVTANTSGTTGLVESIVDSSKCIDVEDLPIAWFSSISGDPVNGQWVDVPYYDESQQALIYSRRAAGGFAFLNELDGGQRTSYNWFSEYNHPEFHYYGPQNWATNRRWGNGASEYPKGNRDLYWIMINGETDYDKAATATIPNWDTYWMPPPATNTDRLVLSGTVKLYLSRGPFQLPSGASVEVPIVVVGGEKLHVDPNCMSSNNSDTLTP
jgi:hypothetical protein